MRKIIFILMFLPHIALAQLPISNIRLLNDVIPAINPSQDTTLEQVCTSSSVIKYSLDPSYCSGDTPNDRLQNLQSNKRLSYFKGYDDGLVTIVASYSSATSTDFIKRYNVLLDCTNNTGTSVSGDIYFTFENSGYTPPTGQSDRTQVTITNMDNSEYALCNSNSPTTSFSVFIPTGRDTLYFLYEFVNDNWDSPRPNATIGVECNGGFKMSVTNGTANYSIPGVTTTFITVINSSGGRTTSGEMIYHELTAESGHTYTSSNGYKPSQILETFDTGTLSDDKLFQHVGATAISGTYYNFMDSEHFYDGDTDISAMDFNSNSSYYTRYTLLNHTGSSSSFNYSLEPYLYCEFTDESYSTSLSSISASSHIIYGSDVTSAGYLRVYVPKIWAIPRGTLLGSTDTFSFEFKANCPNGGYISFVVGGNTYDLYDGDTKSLSGGSYSTEGRTFNSVGMDDAEDQVTISGGSQSGGASVGYEFRFINANSGAYIEIVPTEYCTVNSNYYYKLDATGMIP